VGKGKTAGGIIGKPWKKGKKTLGPEPNRCATAGRRFCDKSRDLGINWVRSHQAENKRRRRDGREEQSHPLSVGKSFYGAQSGAIGGKRLEGGGRLLDLATFGHRRRVDKHHQKTLSMELGNTEPGTRVIKKEESGSPSPPNPRPKRENSYESDSILKTRGLGECGDDRFAELCRREKGKSSAHR